MWAIKTNLKGKNSESLSKNELMLFSVFLNMTNTKKKKEITYETIGYHALNISKNLKLNKMDAPDTYKIHKGMHELKTRDLMSFESKNHVIRVHGFTADGINTIKEILELNKIPYSEEIFKGISVIDRVIKKYTRDFKTVKNVPELKNKQSKERACLTNIKSSEVFKTYKKESKCDLNKIILKNVLFIKGNDEEAYKNKLETLMKEINPERDTTLLSFLKECDKCIKGETWI